MSEYYRENNDLNPCQFLQQDIQFSSTVLFTVRMNKLDVCVSKHSLLVLICGLETAHEYVIAWK